jgi:ring-1,2-phenylacetyl-CoA epoxidase subunit PaaC
MFHAHPVEEVVAAQGVGVDPATVADEVEVLLEHVLALSGVERPAVPAAGAVAGGTGRHGRHTEALGLLLAEMQVVARAHPRGQW